MPWPLLNIFLLLGMLKNRRGSISAARFDHGLILWTTPGLKSSVLVHALGSHLSGELHYPTFEQPAAGQYFILHNSVI